MSEMKPILFIVPQPFFELRGSSFRVLATIVALTELGYELHLLTYPFGESRTVPGVKHIRCAGPFWIKSIPIGPSWRKMLVDVFLFLKSFSLCLRNDYAAIHGVEEGGVIAHFITRFTRTPYVFDMHSWMSEQLRDSRFIRSTFFLRLFRILELRCMRHARVVMTVGPAYVNGVQALVPSVEAIAVEDRALDLMPTSHNSPVINWREKLGLGESRIILYTGNFESYQGIDLLIRSFALAFPQRDAGHPVLVLVGGGDNEHPLVQKYRELSQSLGLGSAIIFAGNQPSELLKQFLELAEVVVSPRITGENPPLKLYTYMESEKLIVATRIRSHTQILEDSCALLAEPTEQAFATALVHAVDGSPFNTARRKRCIEAAKKLLHEKYSRAAFNSRIAQVYRSLLGDESLTIARSEEKLDAEVHTPAVEPR